MNRRLVTILRACLVILVCAGSATSQESGASSNPILTIESDRLFLESDFGQRAERETEADRSVLLAENRKIEAELTAEEKRLTELRKDMTAEDFRAVADAFDARVQEIRRIQDAKARAIGDHGDQERADFLRAAGPVLAEMLSETGAAVILERRSVFFSLDAIDITNQAIDQLNRTIGDGAVPSGDQ